jgi:hypothetical protein
MLGKVMKYEFRASGRLLWPLFGLSIAVSGLMRLLLLVAPYIWSPLASAIEGVATLLGVLLPIAVFALAFIYVAARFYQSTVTDEAYLTFTLPVSANTHICARLIVSIVYTLMAGVVTFICAFIMLLPYSVQAIDMLFSFSQAYVTTGTWLAALGLFLAFVLVALINSFLHLYASMGIGAQFGRNKVIAGVVTYFALSAVSGIVTLALIALPMFSVFQNEDAFVQFIGNGMITSTSGGFIQAVADQVLRVGGIALAIFGSISLIVSVLFYVITWYTYSKKLNLE